MSLFYSVFQIFTAMAPKENTTDYTKYTMRLDENNNSVPIVTLHEWEAGYGRSAGEQAAYQLAALAVTMVFAIVGGVITGEIEAGMGGALASKQPLKASAHSFKQFTSRLLKSIFSLSLCTYITRMDVMLDFICMGPVDLPGARRKRQNTKLKISCPQWDSNPQPFDSKSDALPTELARAWWMLSI